MRVCSYGILHVTVQARVGFVAHLLHGNQGDQSLMLFILLIRENAASKPQPCQAQ